MYEEFYSSYKQEKERKKPKKTKGQIFELDKKENVKENMDKLKKHPKKDKSGQPFSKFHFDEMEKLIKKGMSYSNAHKKALKIEKSKKK